MEDIEQKPSRALPIGVAAGLAVAVFGVLFAIRGSGKAADSGGDVIATAPPGDKSPPATDKPPDKQPVATAPSDKPPPSGVADAGIKAAAAAPPDAAAAVVVAPRTIDAGAAAARPVDNGSTLATLTFVVTPKEAAQKADITVDKKPVLGDRFQVQKGDAVVKVMVRAPGFVPFEKDVTPTADQSIAAELKKIETAIATPPKNPTVTKPPPQDPTLGKPPIKKPPAKPKKPKIEL